MMNPYMRPRNMKEYFKVTNILAANSFQERTKPICNLGQDSFIVVARYTVWLGRAGLGIDLPRSCFTREQFSLVVYDGFLELFVRRDS